MEKIVADELLMAVDHHGARDYHAFSHRYGMSAC